MQHNTTSKPQPSLKHKPNQLSSVYPFDKEGSFGTSSTASVDETSSLKSDSNNKSPVPRKLKMTISTPSKTKAKLNEVDVPCILQNDGSFKVDDDSNWWQSPKVPADEMLLHDEKAPSSLGLDVPTLDDVTNNETLAKPEEKTTEKKKKVKRISMMKVTAGDMAGLSSQFQKTGNFEADQKELQKIVTKLKADKAARERSSKTEGNTTSSTSKPRSQSKMRTHDDNEGESSGDAHQRSKSTGRRASEAEIVDLTTSARSRSVARRSRSDNEGESSGDAHHRSKSTGRRASEAEIVDLTTSARSRSVARRSRSVARNEETDDGHAGSKADEAKKSSTRGRSVGKRITGPSVNTLANGKVRERSRSVARQRISDVDNYDDQGDNDPSGQLQPRKHNIIDLATGLAFVDRDTRSRSVARKRPGEEEANATESKSLGSRSKSSMMSRDSEKEKLRSKSVGRKVRSSEESSSHQSSSSRGEIVSLVSDKEKRRSKSTGRKVRSSEETSSHQSSSSKGEAVSTASEKEKRRSKSVGRPLKIIDNHSVGKGESSDPANIGKSIPWNEFLKHAQSD